MQLKKFIYFFRYDITESALCKLESRYVFNQEEKNRLLFSDIKVEPSSSAFIKNRLEIISSSKDYATLINEIKKENISAEGFKVEYLVAENDTTEYSERLKKLRDIGFSIEGIPDYYSPTITYALYNFDGIWCFGILTKNKDAWQKHNQKPHSYSNSIGINIAKSLVNIAAKGNKECTLIDACCGVGTIMLEACFAGYKIEGCDINWKQCWNARKNLAYFNYDTTVFRSDINDISKRYDAAIIDLPYNLGTLATEEEVLHIIVSTAKIADRLVIVSTSDITNFINQTGFKISDICSVPKKGKRTFARKIWVCEK